MSEANQRRISVKKVHEGPFIEGGIDLGRISADEAEPHRVSSRTSNNASLIDNTNPPDGRMRLPPINKSETPKTEVIRREPNQSGPPINRASALRYYATRERIDHLNAATSIYSSRTGRKSRALRGFKSRGAHSLNDSINSQNRSSRASNVPSRLSQYSAVHPLSENHDDLFHLGRTKWSDEQIRSKIGSLDNYYHRPGGGDKDIREIRYHLNAPNSISSTTKIIYGPRRNDAGVSRGQDHDSSEFFRLPNRISKPINVTSRVGSLDNAHHQAGGGTRAIFTERLPWQAGYKHRKG